MSKIPCFLLHFILQKGQVNFLEYEYVFVTNQYISKDLHIMSSFCISLAYRVIQNE